MRHSFARLLGVTFFLAATAASPAQAANELGLSLDGVHWSASISSPLFDPSFRWVPGDSETATFFVRNQGETAGDLTVDAVGSSMGNLLDSGDLHIKATGGGGKWTVVSEPGNHRLLTAPNIPDGQVVPIKVNVAFDYSSPNSTQLRAAEVNFLVTLSESIPAGSSNGGDDDKGGFLPGTGAPEVRWIVVIGAMLIGIGFAFVSRGREPDEEEVHV